MIRQAHTYLAGAVSGTALIGAAVVAFVLLVSLQALRDWPLAGLGLGNGGSAAGQASHSGAAPGTAVGTAAHRAGGKVGAATTGRHRRVHGAPGGEAGLGRSPSPGAPGGQVPSAAVPGAGAGGGAAGAGGLASGGGGGSSSGGGGETGGSGKSPSGTVTGTINETVSGVDKATGGALGETGVTEAAEETVNGVAGPESPGGKTVDGTAEAVGGTLDTGH